MIPSLSKRNRWKIQNLLRYAFFKESKTFLMLLPQHIAESHKAIEKHPMRCYRYTGGKSNCLFDSPFFTLWSLNQTDPWMLPATRHCLPTTIWTSCAWHLTENKYGSNSLHHLRSLPTFLIPRYQPNHGTHFTPAYLSLSHEMQHMLILSCVYSSSCRSQKKGALTWPEFYLCITLSLAYASDIWYL